ncbi:hypothetical protein THERMOS_1338 [Bathymodiolus thermophilus thioautotrophic gill symbiont]|uniref:Uncharacterized protein n=1 Tax=Bathymodiolus thermophilus thioautotrophic gill symbiont TaxID=2360 RepID=A0A8H8XEH1_9GAMM|nr:hypothetical protein THERMOS_1338 [Bathymodiolus thermophilus thioautotrophic gill symbiont]
MRSTMLLWPSVMMSMKSVVGVDKVFVFGIGEAFGFVEGSPLNEFVAVLGHVAVVEVIA